MTVDLSICEGNIPLGACVLGLSILGCLGYRTVQYLANKSGSSAPIYSGHGEYVIFSNRSEKQVAKRVFENAHQIFQRYPLGTFERYEHISKEIKQIDPTLEIAFIPRTLYELFFIRKVIQEDLKNGSDCPLLDRKPERKLPSTRKKCWHQCYFEDVGNDNQTLQVADVAYRLNLAIVKKLSPKNGGFTLQELERHLENEIAYLKRHYVAKHPIKSGPAINFSCEVDRCQIKPMGVRDNGKDENIIKEALRLECSEIARRCFLLYRGADFEKDSPIFHGDSDRAFSMSYGTSLFAGCIYDGGATVFHYMRKTKHAFAIPVPFDELKDSPFYYPKMNPVAQLYGNGEIFHARSKIWKEYDPTQTIVGIQGVERVHTDHLRSDLRKQELCVQFEAYKSQAMHLCKNTN